MCKVGCGLWAVGCACGQAMMDRQAKAGEASKSAGMGKRTVDAFPTELIFFFRVLELLQGICSRTGHQVGCCCVCVCVCHWRASLVGPSVWCMPRLGLCPCPCKLGGFCRAVCRSRVHDCARFLQIMPSLAKYARRALMDRCDPSLRVRSLVYPSPAGSMAQSLSLPLSKCLEDLVLAERVLGMQVCVVQGSAVLVDIAAGCMGQLDPRPVTPATLFPCVAVSRLAPIAIIASLADSGLLCTFSSGFRMEGGGGVCDLVVWPPHSNSSAPPPPLPFTIVLSPMQDFVGVCVCCVCGGGGCAAACTTLLVFIAPRSVQGPLHCFCLRASPPVPAPYMCSCD
jgi:hypothetical protein